jgi:DNA (cytosine-5)-methyltransferase 1
MNYYNEFDPYAATWLRNLISAGYLPKGEVDERPIQEVTATDLVGFTQCHFFAGIGGWSLALKLAGWPEDRPVWTGSCPCQPFSCAGKRKGFADERHLWPVFHALIGKCRPPTVVGEQVASKDGIEWLDTVCADMEASGYAVGSVVLPACSVGAFHLRYRTWWVADCQNRDIRRAGERIEGEPMPDRGRCSVDGLADSHVGKIEGAFRPGQGGNTKSQGPSVRYCASDWNNPEWLPCTDGKARPTEPGLLPLAYGIPRSVGQAVSWLGSLGALATASSLALARKNRVGRLKGCGNAIVPQVAAEVIGAYMDSVSNPPGNETQRGMING